MELTKKQEQKFKKVFEELFTVLTGKANKNDTNYNELGRLNVPFIITCSLKIDTVDKFVQEVKKIQDKTSDRSSRERAAILRDNRILINEALKITFKKTKK